MQHGELVIDLGFTEVSVVSSLILHVPSYFFGILLLLIVDARLE